MKKFYLLTGALCLSSFVGTTASASSYTVLNGDTLYSISKKSNVSVDDLKSINSLTSNTIRVGQVLQLSRSTQPNNNNSTASYIVKTGDTATKIAKANNLTVAELAKLNPTITNISKIYVGQKLLVSASVENITSNLNTNNTIYTVKTGDTFSKIALAHGLTMTSLQALNPTITNVSIIYVGQQINVPQVKQNTPVPPTTNATTFVANNVINAGKKYLGARYLYGASVNRTDAFDCSSFSYRAYLEGANITLPRTAAAQSSVGKNVSLNALQVGDLVFFDTDFNGSITHVGIYFGNGQMINASTSLGVSYASITSGYWKQRLVKAQRIL